ncbi:MAG: hypothetical protein ACR2NG_05640 [Acidimicrobiia bacterium]
MTASDAIRAADKRLELVEGQLGAVQTALHRAEDLLEEETSHMVRNLILGTVLVALLGAVAAAFINKRRGDAESIEGEGIR